MVLEIERMCSLVAQMVIFLLLDYAQYREADLEGRFAILCGRG